MRKSDQQSKTTFQPSELVAMVLAASIFLPCASSLAEDANEQPTGLLIRSYDGTHIAAGIRKPPGEGPFPAILFIHGGLGGSMPEGMVQFTTNPVPDHFFRRGFVVMSTDYRRYHFGEDEIQDVVAAYRRLESEPYVDKSRLGVIGGSHGGYLTMMLATRVQPAVAVSFAGLSDIEEMFFDRAQRMREALQGYDDWRARLLANRNARRSRAQRADRGNVDEAAQEIEPNGSASFEVALDLAWSLGDRRELYQRISPLQNADKISCPLLYVVGSEDQLRRAGKKVVDSLSARGATAEYSEHEGMGHGFYWGTRGPEPPQQFHDALEVTTAFVERFLNR